MHWNTQYSNSETFSILEDLCAGIRNTYDLDASQRERLDEVISLVKSRDISKICNYKIDYSLFARKDAELLAAIRQVLAFYTKNEDFADKEKALQATMAKFEDAEKACLETNNFFRALSSGCLSLTPLCARVFYAAKEKIEKILGRAPSLDKLAFRFGPGATTTITKSDASIQIKLAESPTCSETMLRHPDFPSFLREFPHWLDCHEKDNFIDAEGFEVAVVDVVVTSSKLSFVPKSATAFRTVLTQPTLNTLFTLGVGDYMVKRLRASGIDLSNQFRNRGLARKGSLLGDSPDSLATIDLSSASDTVSYELVKFLLPPAWFNLLRLGRCSDYTTGRGSEAVTLQQFSSMGNGYTFPLETLIFYALTWSAMRDSNATSSDYADLSVYGDDIIIPSKYFAVVREVLQCAGFSLNNEKSFHTGNFRESCGADYFWGFDIRPCYFKKLVTNRSLFTLHNFLKRNYRDEFCKLVKELIPEHVRLFGPDGYGDGHLIAEDWPSYRNRVMRRRGYGGVYFKTYKDLGRSHESIYPGDYVTPLYTIYVTGPSGLVEDSLDLRDFSPTVRASGRHVYDLPGTRGFEVVSIYTFK